MYFAQSLPDAPSLPLSGSGFADVSIEEFISTLDRDRKSQSKHGLAQVMNSDGDDADTYTLVCWEILSGSSCYEAVVLLYYQPVNTYATILKYFPDLAEDYRRDRPQLT